MQYAIKAWCVTVATYLGRASVKYKARDLSRLGPRTLTPPDCDWLAPLTAGLLLDTLTARDKT